MKIAGFRAAVMGAALSVAAAQPAAAQDKAAEVMAAARAAIGGKKLDAMKTFSVEARMARNIGDQQMRSTLELLVEAPDKYARIEEMTAPIARTMVTGFNGETAMRPGGGVSTAGGMRVVFMGPGGATAPGEKMTPEQEAEMNRAMLRSQREDISRLMLGWFAATHPALQAAFTYAGEAESPDGKAHVIDVKAGDFDARLFIDQATNLPLMLTFQAPRPRVMTMRGPAPAAGAGGHGAGAGQAPAGATDGAREMQRIQSEPPVMVENRLFFSDWREVDGVMFPHVLQRASENETVEEWEISKVRINPKIDPKKFQQ